MIVDFYKSDPADKIMISFKIHKMMESAELYKKQREENTEHKKENEASFHQNMIEFSMVFDQNYHRIEHYVDCLKINLFERLDENEFKMRENKRMEYQN